MSRPCWRRGRQTGGGRRASKAGLIRGWVGRQEVVAREQGPVGFVGRRVSRAGLTGGWVARWARGGQGGGRVGLVGGEAGE